VADRNGNDRLYRYFIYACMNLLITTDYMLVSSKYLNCGILIIQLLRGFNMVAAKIVLWVPC